jgi:hypothetical protein
MNNQKSKNMGIKRDFKNEQKKFEFTVYLNDNIIVQRFFNVIGFNNRAINSLNFKDVVDYNKELIMYHLKSKTLDFMNENIRNFYENQSFEENSVDDVLKIVVKMDGRVIAYREWDATIYPVKVRYTVDVREHIYEMITRIQKCLSEKNERLETKYLGYDLAV